MATTRNDAQGSPRTGDAEPARRRPTPARKGFDKDRATLWLLTVTLGLGLGTATRFIHRGEVTAGGGTASASQQQVRSGPSPAFQSQRVLILPQQSYRARATTRMS